MKTRRHLAMGFLLAGTWLGFSHGPALYEAVDVAEGPYPMDVGSHGEVLMSTYVLLPTPEGGYLRRYLNASSAGEINKHGEIVGHTASQAYIWKPSASGDYIRVAVPMTWAFGINNAGEVAGCFPSGGYYHPFVWMPDEAGVWRASNLGTLGGRGGYAIDINDAGEVCGYAWTTGDEHAFYWTRQTGMLDLGTLGGSQSSAWAINNRGEIAGSAFDREQKYHPFFWSPSSGMVDVGTLGGSTDVAKGYGMDINKHGQVVGSAFDLHGKERAIVWTARDGLRDLNDLIAPSQGLQLVRAVANNDQGQILTGGFDNSGAPRVLLLRSLDRIGPVISLNSPPVLWPADRKLWTFDVRDWVAAIVDDSEGTLPVERSCRIVRIYSDEPEDAPGQGDGHTRGDIRLLSTFVFRLRAERAAQGNGRVYGVWIEAWDSSGNVTEEVIRFGVPLNRRHFEVVDDGPEAGWVVEPGSEVAGTPTKERPTHERRAGGFRVQ